MRNPQASQSHFNSHERNVCTGPVRYLGRCAAFETQRGGDQDNYIDWLADVSELDCEDGLTKPFTDL